MYRTFYGFYTPPFSPQPDIGFLYLNENRQQVLRMVEYAVRERAGFCVISGKAGIGKTVLIHALIKRLGKQVHAGLATCVPGATPDFTELIATAFDIDTSSASTSEMYRRIKDYIADLSSTGKCALLIIDNAHNLKPAIFKLLVHLASLDKALQVILVGHPELRQQFCRPALGESAPDVIIQTELSEFNLIETDAYIRHRIVTAGGAENLFSRSASETVYRFSRGVPGLINCACNYALEAGYEGKHRIIDQSIISDLLKDGHDSEAVDITDNQQKIAVIPAAADEATGKKPGAKTGKISEQDISDFIRLSSQHQRRQSRRLVYASLAGILLPATAAVWLFFQLRPGEHMGQGEETRITNNIQPATEQLENENLQHIETSPPPLASLPAKSEKTETTDKLAKINALNELKAMQRKLEGRLVEQRIEQARIEEETQREKEMQRELESRLREQRVERAQIKEAMQREQERIAKARSLLGETHKPEAETVVPAAVPPAQDTQVYAVPAGHELPDETEKLAVIEELKERQRKLVRHIAEQRYEYNLIKEKISKEDERIIKARAVIKKAYKSARLIWDHFNNATPEPYPEDLEQP